MKKLIVITALLFSVSGNAQQYSYKKKQITQGGSMYFLWGYNRSIYAKSDINFTGDKYNFTVHKATAHDKPSREFKTYVNPSTISVPQFNLRVGYYTNTSWDISVGYDHMKYVMTADQQAKLTGFIPAEENSYINGELDGEIYRIRDEFIHYENSNGLNYITAQATYNKLLFKTENRAFAIRARAGFGIGAVVTQTDFRFNNVWAHTKLKLTGFGASVHTAARFEFFNRFFAQTKFSTGAIALPHLQTIANTNNYARQKFVYGEWQIVGGVFWYLKFKNNCNSCPDWH